MIYGRTRREFQRSLCQRACQTETVRGTKTSGSVIVSMLSTDRITVPQI